MKLKKIQKYLVNRELTLGTSVLSFTPQNEQLITSVTAAGDICVELDVNAPLSSVDGSQVSHISLPGNNVFKHESNVIPWGNNSSKSFRIPG